MANTRQTRPLLQEIFKGAAQNWAPEQRLYALKTLQNQVITHAEKDGHLVECFYFGSQDHFVDEEAYPDEMRAINQLLESLPFSQALHDRLDDARDTVIAAALDETTYCGWAIASFDALDIEQRLELATLMQDILLTAFFGADMPFAVGTIDHDPERDCCFHRPYNLLPQETVTVPGYTLLSSDAVGPEATAEYFCNLAFHENVHALMTQLAQLCSLGHIDQSDPLYADGMLRATYVTQEITPKYALASIYPNFLEESLACYQAVRFAAALGYMPVSAEDRLILQTTNRRKPLDPPGGFAHFRVA